MQAGAPPPVYNQWGQTPQAFPPTSGMFAGPGAPHGYPYGGAPQVVDLAALEAAAAGAEEENDDSSSGSSRWYRMRELLAMPEERALLLDGGPSARVAYALRCLRFLPPRRPLDHRTAASRPQQQQRLGEDVLADLFEAAQAALGPDQASSSSGGQMRPGHSSLSQWFDIPPAPVPAPATATGSDRMLDTPLSAPAAAAATGSSSGGASSAIIDIPSAQSAPLAPAPAPAALPAAPRLPLATSMPAAQRWLSAGALLPRPTAAPAVSQATFAMLRVVDVALLRLHAQTMSPLDAVAWGDLPPPPPEGAADEESAQVADDELAAAPSAPTPAQWVPSALVLALDRTPFAASAGLLAGTAATPRQTAAAVALSACSGSGAPWRVALDRLVSLLDGAFTAGPAPPPLSLLLTAITQSSRAALDAPDASAAPARLVAAVSAPGGGPDGATAAVAEARRMPGVAGTDAACLSGPALRQLRSLLLLHAFRLYRAYQAALLQEQQQQGGDNAAFLEQGGTSESLQAPLVDAPAPAGDGATKPRLAGSKRRRQSSDGDEEPGGGGDDDDGMGRGSASDSGQAASADDNEAEEAVAADAASGVPLDGTTGGGGGSDKEEDAEGGGGGDDDYSAFVTRALDALLTLSMEATALALRGARDVPTACAAARDVGAADLLGGFLLDLPYLPPQVSHGEGIRVSPAAGVTSLRAPCRCWAWSPPRAARTTRSRSSAGRAPRERMGEGKGWRGGVLP